MTTYENGTPETPDWSLPNLPRPCVLDDCVCTNAQESIWLHGSDEHIRAAELARYDAFERLTYAAIVGDPGAAAEALRDEHIVRGAE